MLTWRRVVTLAAILLLAALGWTTWTAVQTARDLRTAERAVERIRAAVSSDDPEARATAIEELVQASSAARDRTDGIWWASLTMLPFVGDDVGGVRDLSASLELVASRAVQPLGETVDELEVVVANGRVDVERLRDLAPKIDAAHSAFASAAQLVTSRKSSGFAGPLRSRYEEYVDQVSSLARDLSSAATAVDVLPSMLGGSEPRQYLLIFENNAEIRATGGLPGSWALIKADDGKLSMSIQGSAADFDAYANPLGDITDAESSLFGREMGRFFQDPNFTPDFPRAAEVFNAFWSEKYPDVSLDGVISLDVVSLSYLLEGTGPVRVGDLTLTSTNAVDVLLRDVYEEPDPAKQNEIFESVARAVFESATSTLKQPVAFVEGLSRAARERRFHVASFDKTESLALSGTLVEGRLSRDLDASPVVDIALNDATASKMSYYLRYNTDIQSVSCDEEGRQQLEVTMTLSQSISPAAARQLPRYVTGSAQVGMDRGNQFVRAHIFAPLGGDIRDIKINGSAVATPNVVDLSGRPAVTLAVLIDSLEDVVVTMRLTTGGGQDSDGVISSTPSVVPGLSSKTFSSSCA